MKTKAIVIGIRHCGSDSELQHERGCRWRTHEYPGHGHGTDLCRPCTRAGCGGYQPGEPGRGGWRARDARPHAGGDPRRQRLPVSGLYKKYFTGEESSSGRVGKHLSNQDKQDILASFPNGVGRISAHVEARPIGLSVRLTEHSRVALTMTEYVMVNAMVPHDYAEFLFYGNTPGSTYSFGETSAMRPGCVSMHSPLA